MIKNPPDRITRPTPSAPALLAMMVGAALSLCATAIAEEQSDTTPYEVQEEDVTLSLEPKHNVDLSISPYIWLPSLSGTVKVNGAELDVDQTFLDTLDQSDAMFGLMGAVDLNINRWVFQLNGAWTISEYSGDRSDIPDVTLRGDLTLQTLWMEFFGGYRFIDHKLADDDPLANRKMILDGFVGVRYTRIWQDGTLKIRGDFVPEEGDPVDVTDDIDLDSSKNWFEPFIGLRFGYDITDHWSLVIRGDVGGFGAGSDFAWQTFGGVGYRWYLKGWSIAAYGGFRALGQDYSDGDFEWDVITYGPIIGAQFSFAF